MQRSLGTSLGLLLAGCAGLPGWSVVSEGVAEVLVSARGEVVVEELVELSTRFEPGGDTRLACVQLQEVFTGRFPCGSAACNERSLQLELGDASGSCATGSGYHGSATLTVDLAGPEDLLVVHQWQGLARDGVLVDGSASVSWAEGDSLHRVEHRSTWSDGRRVVDAEGDREQTLVDDSLGLDGGLDVQGERSWYWKGDWELQMSDTVMPPGLPVPRQGSYSIADSQGNLLGASFEPAAGGAVQVTISGLRRDRVLQVDARGEILEGD